jgi:hypothetical protein
VHTEFWWGNLREGGPLKDPGVGGRISLAYDRDRWWALVRAVMNLQVP